MRFGATIVALALVAMTAASCGGGFFRQYEYEEEIYLALDGSATVYVNASVAALNALRGAQFEANPSATIDRDAVAAFYTTPVTRVTRRPSLSRRSGRRFVHVRLDVDHIDQLPKAGPFSWSAYQFKNDGSLVTFKQLVGRGTRLPSSAQAAPDPMSGSRPHPATGAGPDATTGVAAAWVGDELTAFRLHLPSAVVYHNAGPENLRRGNILVWEQPLAARLAGEPLEFEARIESQSILSRTLLLFAGTAFAVALMFAIIIWRVVRRARVT